MKVVMFDYYDRTARLYPALICISPLAVSIPTLMPIDPLPRVLAGFTALGVGGLLLTQLSRWAGKAGEPKLFSKWSGVPSIAILRHRDGRVDTITKLRYHQKLQTAMPSTVAPSPEAEAADPAAADQVYAAWSNFLRTRPENRAPGSFVFKENVLYGFARNLWGLRWIGAAVSLIALSTVGWTLAADQIKKSAPNIPATVALGYDVMLLLLFLFVFTPAMVKIPADAYAARLLESVDSL